MMPIRTRVQNFVFRIRGRKVWCTRRDSNPGDKLGRLES